MLEGSRIYVDRSLLSDGVWIGYHGHRIRRFVNGILIFIGYGIIRIGMDVVCVQKVVVMGDDEWL